MSHEINNTKTFGGEMNKQELMIKDFRAKFNNPTLKTVSKMTGIQMTRVHRIFKGHEMKLREYLKIDELLKSEESNTINNPKIQTLKLQQLFGECLIELSDDALIEITQDLENKLKVIEILRCNDFKSPTIAKIGA